MLRRPSPMRITWPVLALCAAGLLAFPSVQRSASAALRHHMQGGAQTGARTATTPPNDANIAAIVVAANTIDIQNAREAERVSKNPKVLEFARRMVTDHSAVNKKATDLTKRLDLTPKPDAISRSLESSATKTRTHLATMTGADFDKAYIDNEVSFHQAVLNMMDKTLVPDAQNADLKKLLEDTRPAIESHLEMAKGIQSGLSGTSRP